MERQNQRWWARPETIFLFFALPIGLYLLNAITPFAGGNERMNYQRAVLLAGGHVAIAPASMPGGVMAILDLTSRFFDDRPAPFVLSASETAQLAGISLAADRPRIVPPNAIAVLHPVAYLAQAPVMAVGLAAGASPLRLFMLGRLAGLIAALGLTAWAIRIAPRNRYLLAGVALLPQMLFSRSTLDADQLTNAVAFLFFALLARELAGEGRMQARRTILLAVSAFVFAQAKSAYLLLPLLALFIPTERFANRGARVRAIALMVLPGLAGSLVWMLMLRGGYFHDISYTTWSGLVVPDRQIAAVLHDPAGYVAVLSRTIVTTPLVPESLLGFLGEFGPPVSLPWWVDLILGWLVATLFLSEARVAGRALGRWPLRLAALILAAVSVVIVLTLLYVQWTRVGAPTIEGWHGRYLFPLAPLLVLLLRGSGLKLAGRGSATWLVALGVTSGAATLFMTSLVY